MFRFMKKVFYIGSLFISSLVSTTPLSCISMNNQAYKVRPELMKRTMSRTNERRHIKWHETCRCKCRLGASVCNNENDEF